MVSPALQALYEGDVERATGLLGPDDELDVFEAAAFGKTRRLRRLLDEDPGRAHAFSGDGFTALHLAIFGGHKSTVRLLVERGADLEAVSTGEIAQVRPLGTAAFARSTALGRILLEAGADPQGSHPQGATPMDTPRAHGDEKVAPLPPALGTAEAGFPPGWVN